MTNLHERLAKLERWKRLHSALQPVAERRPLLLQHITDEDLATLALLNDEQWSRVHSHPDFLAMRIDDDLTVEQGAQLAAIATEVMS